MGDRDIRAFKVLFWLLFPICSISFIREPSLQAGLLCLLFLFVLGPVVFNKKRTRNTQIDAATEGVNITFKDLPLFSLLGLIFPLVVTILSKPTTSFATYFLFGSFSFIGMVAAIVVLACKHALRNKTNKK